MLTIAPKEHSTWLAKVSASEVTFLRDLFLDYRPLCVSWSEGVVYLDRETRSLRYVTPDADGTQREWLLPANLTLYGPQPRLAVVGDRVYVAAGDDQAGSPALFSGSLLDDQPDWSNAYPDTLSYRKEIDALIVHGSRLIAVDDVVFPKYLFVLDGAEAAGAPPRIHHLPGHGTYERVLSACLCQSGLAVISTTTGMGGSGVHVSLLDLETLEETGCLSAHRGWDAENGAWTSNPKTLAEALQDLRLGADLLACGSGRLVAACGSHGVVILNPERIDMTMDAADADTQSIARAVGIDELPLPVRRDQGSGDAPQTVTDVVGAGEAGCVAIVQFSSGYTESVLLTSDFLTILLP